MKTRKQILVASLITMSLVTSLTAQAGFLDWFRTDEASANVVSAGSFDSLYASVANGPATSDEKPTLIANAVIPANSPTGSVSPVLRKTYWVTVSGYNSEVAQTDDSPFITAKGTYVRDGIVAANSLNGTFNVPFGTALKFKNCGSVDPEKIFVVEDRMNTRYQRNVDIWFESKADAISLGRRLCQIEVIK